MNNSFHQTIDNNEKDMEINTHEQFIQNDSSPSVEGESHIFDIRIKE